MAGRAATPEEKEIAAQAEAALKNEPPIEDPKPDTPSPLQLNPDAEEPERRRPGRPKKNSGNNLEDKLQFNPVEGDAGSKSTRKPGRPSKADSKVAIDPGKLGNQLIGIHQLMAMFTNTPELQLTPQAGQALGEAIVAVCNEYDLNISGKTGAMVQLLATSAMIYAPMVMQIRYRVAQEELAREQSANQTIPSASFTGPLPTN